MYGMPAGMPEIVSSSAHEIRTYAYVYQRPWPPGGYLGTPWAWTGTELLSISPLPVETGTMTIDNTGVQRRRATMTIAPIQVGAPDSPLPTSVNSALTPYRNMVLLYYGVGNGDTPVPSGSAPQGSMYLLGIFTLTDVKVSVTHAGKTTIQMDLQDLSQEVARRVLTKPYVTSNGVLMTRAVQELLDYSAQSGFHIPWFQADANPAQTSTGSSPGTHYAAGYTWDEGQDPWEACQQIAEACGMQLYFTPTGVCQMSYIPNPYTTPTCWTYATGLAPNVNPMITSIDRTFSQSQVFNFVEYVVEGANANPSPDLLYTGTSFLAQIGDTDPSSPTYMYGPYGVAADVQFDMLNYQPETALIAAKARLRRDLGAADMVTFTALPNPAHEAYDRITVLAPEIGLAQDYIIDTVELPLDAGKDMTVTARRVVNVP